MEREDSGAIWWPPLCGNDTLDDAFWSPAISVNTSSPDLTECLQETCLSWTPCAYLLLVGFVYMPYLCGRRQVNPCGKASGLNKTKIVLCSLLCVAQVVELIYLGVWTDEPVRFAAFVRAGNFVPAYIQAAVIMSLEFKRGVHSGGVMFFFWLMSAVLYIVPFRSKILHITYDDQGAPVISHLPSFILFYINYGLILVEFCLALVPDMAALGVPEEPVAEERQPLLGNRAREEAEAERPGEGPTQLKPCEEERASFLSQITYSWVSKLILLGYRRDLVFSDFCDIRTEDKCQTILNKFEREWDKELKKTKFQLVNTKNYGAIPDAPLGDSGQYEKHQGKDVRFREDQRSRKRSKVKEPSSWSAIMRTFGASYLLGGLFKLAYDLISFVNPQILNLLIAFIASGGSAFVWQGYLYAAALFLVSMTRTVILQQYWDYCFRIGLRLRTAVTGSIYRKSLRLSNAAKRTTTAGEIVNLMSVDAQKLQDAPAYMHMLWSTPLTIALATYFLWQQLGPSVLAGVAVMFLLLPVNGIVAAKTRKLQVDQMRFKDARIKLVNEVLNGIKVLKLYAWEESFRTRVLDIRNNELDRLRTSLYLSACSSISWFMTPYLVALSTFAVFVLSSPENVLTANKAFVSLSLFNLLNYPMSILPAVLTFGVQAAVSIGRITKFLKNEEINPDNVEHNPAPGDAVRIEDATFSWCRDELPVLRNIDLTVAEGSLVAVVGQVGSGKSSLISAILGEMEVMKGKVNVKRSVAYVPQQAWIQNLTLRNNILFSESFKPAKYKRVIDACALGPDLEILSGGDMTEIGEKGINLSGGQKQRVSLARAVYQDSDLYLLDDPLSAVDSHVGKHIFENVLGPKGLLRNKTRVLVTNQLTYLNQTDLIVVLKDGEVSELGNFQELISRNGAFAEFVALYLTEMSEDEDGSPEEEIKELKRQLSHQVSMYAERRDSQSEGESATSSQKAAKKRRRRSSTQKSATTELSKEEKKSVKKQELQRLTEEEQAMSGNVKMSVLVSYLRACGAFSIVSSLVFYAIILAASIGNNIWLSEWSNDETKNNGTPDTSLRDLRLGVYGGIGIAQAIGVLGQGVVLAAGMVAASGLLHSRLLTNILRAPLSFYDTTPLGRMVNRFSRDIDILDVNIPLTTRIWMGTLSSVFTTIVIISYSTPIFLAVLLPLGLLYYFLQRFYIAASRQIKRIDSILRSPIYTHFSETVSGGSSIRAYKEQGRFTGRMDHLVDDSQMAYFASLMANRWIGIWLETIGNFIVLFAAVFAVVARDTITAGLAGLSVSYALQVTGALNMVVRMTSDMETYIVAVERIKEFADCPTEAPAIVEGHRPPRGWPGSGRLQFKNYSTRYRAGLGLVLKDINCTIEPRERVGIVGRTGAGKSSLTLALFRIIEASMGHVDIDHVNIGTIGLRDLRSRLTIIPQDPVLFSGTLRLNLDPFEVRTDEEMWTALEQAHLRAFVSGLPSGLDHLCTEGGENLSVGQRQLVCLARALLRKSKILVLDEATAAIDLETDDLIQTTIRTEFRDCTVVTIAHRLNTIMDYDRVLVLDQGQIVEFDSPGKLQQNTSGVFYGMVRDAGLLSPTSHPVDATDPEVIPQPEVHVTSGSDAGESQ